MGSDEREALENLREVFERWQDSTPPELANAVDEVLEACGPQPCECGHAKGRHRLNEPFEEDNTYGPCIDLECNCKDYRRADDAD